MKIRKKFLSMSTVAVMSFSLMAAVSTQAHAQEYSSNSKEQATKTFAEEPVMADAWFQTSGEAEALYYQGYNIGKMRLDAALKKGTKKKPAIVLDLDETVLNNSQWEALLVKTGKGYPYEWDKFMKSADSTALPGAVDFLKHADKKGVDIYYITNRAEKYLEPTIKNLQKLGIPQANKDHVFLQKPNEHGKQSRRARVAKDHDILLYFGDQLTDFPGFDGKSLKDRNVAVNEDGNKFGNKFIIFPNPMYGKWEDALYGYKNKSVKQKIELRKDQLQYFKP
ncbi:5'-nucleotidase, lipoprotein e(P4) family [Scopulibacillus cellulosilyticus]|uniref:5'-nucleotidase, lipoprotein e(P4) family n=1 Tax=Scopulibacillus cellulosilyticus TaxID=2665665 RepID=A0ABW2PYL4_9BACL